MGLFPSDEQLETMGRRWRLYEEEYAKVLAQMNLTPDGVMRDPNARFQADCKAWERAIERDKLTATSISA